jgi:hypothetical protein
MEQQIILIILTQILSAAGVIAAIKTDISWIKKTQQSHAERITALENRAFCARKTDVRAAEN